MNWARVTSKSELIRKLLPDLPITLPLMGTRRIRFSLKKHMGFFRLSVRMREITSALNILQWVPRGGVILDVGANIGFYTLVFSTRQDVRVHALEPSPIALPWLRENLQINGLQDLPVHEFVLSGEDGTVSFSLDHRTTAASHVAAPGEPGIVLPARSLDSLVHEGRIPPPDVIKFDVEGHELRIFEGMTELIQARKTSIYLEGGNRATDGEIAAARYLIDRGYRIRDCATGDEIPAHSESYPFLATPT
ncbi:MAG: FkbM family methyltransferase [Lysobacterales bacterium]